VSAIDYAFATDPLTVREVAAWLGIHPNTVKRIPSADLPFFTISTRGDRRYHVDDVRAYIERRTTR
jgi:hypothetical protein